jgi:hypothetical protein
MLSCGAYGRQEMTTLWQENKLSSASVCYIQCYFAGKQFGNVDAFFRSITSVYRSTVVAKAFSGIFHPGSHYSSRYSYLHGCGMETR